MKSEYSTLRAFAATTIAIGALFYCSSEYLANTSLLGAPEQQQQDSVQAIDTDIQKLGGYEELYSAISKKHGKSLICVFDYYDLERNWFIRLYVNENRDRSLIVFHGLNVKVKSSIDGKAVDGTDIFTPETIPWELHKAKPFVPPVVGDFVVGHWFRKPATKSVHIAVSSENGCFQIEWDSTGILPRVNVSVNDNGTNPRANQ